jgi:tRNA threonylcarbamoyladenosine biosynthesis protein TsaB
MRILAIETTDRAGTLALLVDDQPIATLELDTALRSAQTLAPGIESLLATAAWTPRDVELVAVAAGPGSFTGLRIGVTTAKMFAYAIGAAVLGVNTLEVIASQIPICDKRLWAILDAQRDQVFAGQFVHVDNQWQRRGETALLDNSEFLTHLLPNDVVAGPALSKYIDQIPGGVQIADRKLWNPTAASVGQIAYRQFVAGRRDDLWRLAPQYFRRSAAEEKRIATERATTK